MRFLAYLLLSWLLNAVVLAVVAWLFTGVQRGTTKQLLVAAAVFGVLNTILKPIMKLVTLPLAIITLGIVWFGVSMLMLWLTDVLVKGFNIEGFWTLVGATAVVWFLNAIIDGLMFLRQRPAGSSDAVALSH